MASCSLPQNVGGLERLGCLALGGWLLFKGILTRRTSRAVVGGLFLYRGLTGHCNGYGALGLDTRSSVEKSEG